MRELKSLKEYKDTISRKTEQIREALLSGDQREARRASDELLLALTESVTILEQATDEWINEIANDR